ncbi:uncharacterized protein [Penaeus vannamei]|uniref:uncharacterized protein n=1 Tax=Penaeus vannamei TaxID=6689 RepID=UPI00387FB0AD
MEQLRISLPCQLTASPSSRLLHSLWPPLETGTLWSQAKLYWISEQQEATEGTRKPRVKVAALSVVRRPGRGTISVGGYTYYRSGRSDGHHLQGVVIAISSRLQPSLVEVIPVNERIMVLRLKLAFSFMSLIAVYTLTNVCKLNVKEIFCTKLASVSDSCPQRDIHIVLGDFNAVSGCDRAGYEMSVGPHGSGADAISKNTLLFPDFARSQNLRISGSWYQRSDPHHWTWSSNAGNAAKEIDHILLSICWRISYNYPSGPLQNFPAGQ